MEIEFAELKDSDFNKVLEIYEYYVKNSTATFHTGSVSVSDLKEFIFIGHPRYRSFLVYCDGEVCGYTFLTRFKKREAYDRTAEVTVYLKPGFTGKGIGKASLGFIENQARKTDIKVLIATISGSNSESLKLFDKQGYLACGHYRQVGEKFGKLLDVYTFQKLL